MEAPQNQAAFSAWLKAMAAHAGVEGPSELHRLLLRYECHCTERAVAEWMSGRSAPSPRKMSEAMVALNKAVPDVDAWEEYRRISRGEEASEVQKKAELEEAGELLDELIQQDPRLPPRLT